LRLVAVALAFCVTAAGQPQEPLRTTARVVEISVIAEDAEGRAVRDLKAEDFTVRDEGRVEKIAFFAARRQSAGAKREFPPGTFTNRFAAGADGLTAILFDGLNTCLVDQAYARQQVIRFLEQLPAGGRVVVYVLGRGPRLLEDEGGPAGLAAALRGHRSEMTRSLAAPLYDPSVTAVQHFDSWLGELGFNLVDYFDRDRAFRTVRSLTAIARHLEGVPGRKNLIWVSGSFPVSIAGGSIPVNVRAAKGGQGGWPETDRLMRALARANVAVYPVDARGLIASDEYAPERGAAATNSRLRDIDTFGVMRTIAERSGGRAVYQNNDIAGALGRAAADLEHTYQIAYYPSHDSWNGSFRELKVEVNRPGVKLHHRRGYFALPDEPKDSGYREDTIEAAMFSPLNATGIGLTVRPTLGSGGVLDLDLGVDTRGVTFEAKDGGWHAALDVWLVQVDTKEKHLKTDARTQQLKMSPVEYQRVMKAQGLRLVEQVKPSNKAMLLKVMVRDLVSGALGSVTVPLK
jgi:VWFA-related protein